MDWHRVTSRDITLPGGTRPALGPASAGPLRFPAGTRWLPKLKAGPNLMIASRCKPSKIRPARSVLASSLLALLTGLFVCGPAHAQSDRALQARYCAGMQLEYRMPDGARADCLSPTYIIEVDFSEKWAESIGQALFYASWTADLPIGQRKAGIILICHRSRAACTNHSARLYRVVQDYRLPLTIWDCDLTEKTLADCQRIDPPGLP